MSPLNVRFALRRLRSRSTTWYSFGKMIEFRISFGNDLMFSNLPYARDNPCSSGFDISFWSTVFRLIFSCHNLNIWSLDSLSTSGEIGLVLFSFFLELLLNLRTLFRVFLALANVEQVFIKIGLSVGCSMFVDSSEETVHCVSSFHLVVFSLLDSLNFLWT